MINPERARQLVLQHAWNTTAYQILNPGIEHWFHPLLPAVIGMVRRGKYWVAGGAPVCALSDLPQVAQDFETAAAQETCKVCYVCAAERLRELYANSKTHSLITIGAQPVWNPQHWPNIAQRYASIRTQLNRAKNKSVRIIDWPAEMGRNNSDLRICLTDWLSHRHFPPLHFMTEPDILDGVLRDRLLWVAMRQKQPVGFLIASPVPQRTGYLLEQIVRVHDAPNGTAELLIDAAMRSLADLNCSYATLGLVALSQHGEKIAPKNPLWLRGMFHWARAHGNRFYNFRGLESFRTKLQPQTWEPIYAISNEPHFSLPTLHAIAAAFCENSPTLAVARALVGALTQEFRWFTHGKKV